MGRNGAIIARSGVRFKPAVCSCVFGSRYNMQIFVKTITGRTLSLEVDSDQKVAVAALRIHTLECIPLFGIELSYKGRKLDFGNRFHEYGIPANATLQVAGRKGSHCSSDYENFCRAYLTPRERSEVTLPADDEYSTACEDASYMSSRYRLG